MKPALALAGMLCLALNAWPQDAEKPGPAERPQPAEVEKKSTRSGNDAPSAGTLLDVKRIYVATLTGGASADQLRDQIIASLSAAKDFIITENEDRADAILRGAADDKTVSDELSYATSNTYHGNTSLYGVGGGGYSRYGGRGTGASLGSGGSENESERDKVHKHEAHAAVRLTNRDGDVIWSTMQESDGGKFRGASADVASRVARQLSLDLERERRKAASGPAAGPGEPPGLPADAKQIPLHPEQ